MLLVAALASACEATTDTDVRVPPPDKAPDLDDSPGDGGGQHESGCRSRPGAEQIAVGGGFTCALQPCGEVVCWGDNRFGQLGHGHIVNLGDDELPNAAGPIDIGGPAASIVAGREYACALRVDGELVCWGMSSDGQLGYGDLDIIGNNELPSEAGTVDVGQAIRSVHAGPWNTCAITDARELVCWGANYEGQLGYGHRLRIGDDEAPSGQGLVDVGAPVLDVAVSSSNTCALLEGGDVRCWGLNGPPLGAGYEVGEPVGDDEVPASFAAVSLGGPAQAIDAGFYHFCALLEAGDVVCWGEGFSGQLGYGNYESIGVDQTPASVGAVAIGEPAVAIALGLEHSCAVGESGAAYCWGASEGGRLGYPEAMGSIGGDLRPIDVGPIALPKPVDELGAGDGHTCARLGPDVHCWGSAWTGALGYGNVNDIGDDEPPATGGPVQFEGGHGNGGVEPITDEFDGMADAGINLKWQAPQPPAALAVGETIHAQGSHWAAFECEDCTDSFVVRAADNQTIIIARINERTDLHPHRGIMNMLALDPTTWLDPLELEVADLGLCPELDSEQEGCFGKRLALDITGPDAPSGQLLDETRGQVGGYMVSVQRLQDWSDACGWDADDSARRLVAIRLDCAPDCGPVDFIDACEPAQEEFDGARLYFSEKQPVDPGYEITCKVLSHELEDDEWKIALDCVGLP